MNSNRKKQYFTIEQRVDLMSKINVILGFSTRSAVWIKISKWEHLFIFFFCRDHYFKMVQALNSRAEKMKKILLDIQGSDVKIWPLRDKKPKCGSSRSKSRGREKARRSKSRKSSSKGGCGKPKPKRKKRSKSKKSAGGCGKKTHKPKTKRSKSRKSSGGCKPKKVKRVKKKRC